MMSFRHLFRFCTKRNLNLNSNSAVAILNQRQQFSNSANENVVRSKAPDILLPKTTIDELIWEKLGKWPDKTALICAETGRSYLYSDLYRKSRALANFLHKFKGLKQDDTIAIVLPNVPEYFIILFAAIQAGFKVTTVNPIYSTDEMARQFTNSNTKLIFTLNQLWSNVSAASKISSKKILPTVIVNTKVQNDSVPPGTIKFDEISEGDHRLQFNIVRKTEDIIVLPYSSGTTGHPKGVEITHRNIIATVVQANSPEFQFLRTCDGTFQEVIPAILPMFHIYGMMLTASAFFNGSKMVTVPKFGSDIFIDVLEKYKPTVAFLVPPIVLLLINHPNIRPHHFENMQRIGSGAAPLGATDMERLQKKCKGKTLLVQGYGMTETTGLTHYQTPNLPGGIKIGGCGAIIPNTEAKIMSLNEDEEKRVALGPNESGELFVRGPQIMVGYHNNPKATKETLDETGWLRTGDISHYDKDGQFYITDRLKELIKVKAFQVPPAELEELLRDHPDIEDAAVIGIPHADFGEVPKAFVVLKNNAKSTNSAKIQEYVASKVVKYKQLVGGVTFMDSIPKNASGKILRRQLKGL